MSAPALPLLDIDALSATLGGRRVIEDLSLAVRAGEFVGLIGPNGAGKSTLIRAICGVVETAGRLAFDGEELAAMAPGERARRIAYVPQEHDIAWPVSVEVLVSLGRTPHRAGFSAALSQADRAAIARAMARMDVTRFAARAATALSGGEKARVLMARALAQETPLILADEPAAGLDPAWQISLMQTFRDLASEGHAVVASMHDLGLAARWCSRLVLIDHGKIVADGKPGDVLTAGNLETVYGVTAYIRNEEDGMIVQPLGLSRPGGADRG